MAEASIPVDILNPGQVFACLGLVEASEVLLGGAEGSFDWTDPTCVRFWVRAHGDASPIAHVLEFLATAEVRAEMPANADHAEKWNRAWGTLESRAVNDAYPFPDPQSPQTVVCVLCNDGHALTIDYWGDTVRDNFKLWAGSAGKPGAALVRDALDLVRAPAVAAVTDPFSISAPQSSSFRLDWRRDYIPIDAGFSLNAPHAVRIEAVGFPLVELLGAIGLTHARPLRIHRRDKLQYRYGIAGRSHDPSLWLSPSILRAALGATPLPFPTRRFRMHLGWPGKEGQARAITTVTEEMSS